MDLKQFKLSSGEEIIALVVEWPDEDSLDIVIRNPVKIHSVLGPDGNFYHTLKPFMVYQFAEDNLIILNASNIIAEGNPNKIVSNQYDRTIKDLLSENEEPVYKKVSPPKVMKRDLGEDSSAEIIDLIFGENKRTVH